jgi:hypothetical protein
MLNVSSDTMIGEVRAYATSGRGLTPEELAEMALPKLVHVAETTCPELRAQAEQFKTRVRALLIAYMRQAIKSDRTTLHNQFTRAGFPQAAAIIAQV